MSERKKLQEALCRYVFETFSYIDSMRGFCKKISEWACMRRTERKMMMYIKNRADGDDQSEDKVQDFQEYMWSNEAQLDADPGEQLAVVLKDTLRGLEELDCFLDAVEKLAITSHHVFTEDQVLNLTDYNFEHVQEIIAVARLICPLLLSFKRDAKVFFLPKLQNVEVLSNQLDMYIETTQIIFQELAKSLSGDFCLKMTLTTKVLPDVNMSEDDITRMLNHINQLHNIRMNQHSRTVFLFEKESCFTFISEFKKRQPRMLQCLKELEECAVQLDRMNKGSKISSVAGSSVGAVGGVLSIIGLVLVPFTAGASLGLTIAGTGMGIASGVNSAVTTATEVGVNATQEKKASDIFKVFMEDVQVLQDCLQEVMNKAVLKIELNVNNIVKGVKKFAKTAKCIVKKIRSLGPEVRNVKLLRNGGQAAAKGTLGLSKSARVGNIATNALFIGMDIYSICKDSIDLAKGSETIISQFIRARSALWNSEIDSWQKIHDSLCEGLQTTETNEALLETPLYPELDSKKKEEATEEDNFSCCVVQ